MTAANFIMVDPDGHVSTLSGSLKSIDALFGHHTHYRKSQSGALWVAYSSSHTTIWGADPNLYATYGLFGWPVRTKQECGLYGSVAFFGGTDIGTAAAEILPMTSASETAILGGISLLKEIFDDPETRASTLNSLEHLRQVSMRQILG